MLTVSICIQVALTSHSTPVMKIFTTLKSSLKTFISWLDLFNWSEKMIMFLNFWYGSRNASTTVIWTVHTLPTFQGPHEDITTNFHSTYLTLSLVLFNFTIDTSLFTSWYATVLIEYLWRWTFGTNNFILLNIWADSNSYEVVPILEFIECTNTPFPGITIIHLLLDAFWAIWRAHITFPSV